MSTILSRHFTLEELCQSSTAKKLGIKNTPGAQEIAYLTALTTEVLEPLREWYGKPIVVASGYRCPMLNKAVGGVTNSQHMKGQAVDLFLDGDIEKGKKWFAYIRDHLPFDQLIMERNAKGTRWVHVSFDPMGNRKQVINDLVKN